MGSKLLFVFGIIAAHGALAAAWVHDEVPKSRSLIATCVNTPVPLPYFQPPREVLAMNVIPIVNEEVWQP